MPTQRTCSIHDCGRLVKARGWCSLHYQRWCAHGDPSVALRPANGEAQSYFENVVLTYAGDECLIWPFVTNGEGYARVRNDGKPCLVSRMVCDRIYGPPPTQEHQAAHSCGNGHLGCVTKGHLSWKTPIENHADKILHGTVSRGEQNGQAKLTEASVREILAAKGVVSQRELATRFNISKSAIWNIHTGNRWGWLSQPDPQHATGSDLFAQARQQP